MKLILEMEYHHAVQYRWAAVRLRRVDLNLFILFDALYREQNVTRVAQQLHLSQPAVSNALARLREAFGDPLFLRTPEGMIPTPVADNMIGDVRRALALLNRAVAASERFDPATSEKRFRVAFNHPAQLLILPELWRLTRTRSPSITLANYYQTREAAAEELRSGALDLLVDAPQFNAREFGQRPLLALPYAVAMRPQHPLAGRPLGLEDYLAAQHLHVSSRKRGRGQADVALHGLGLRRQIALRLQDYSVAAEVVRGSDLLWTVPAVLGARFGLCLAAPPFEVEPLRLNLYWPRGAEEDPANRWLRDLVVEAALPGEARRAAQSPRA
ncbi:MAG: transcriptional regulator [Porticoccaceae bacterium]|nr:MAG: transcriptional regulator [Porticoccaceae bacterium]